MKNYVMTFELFNTTYLSAASKLKEKGHFTRASNLQDHAKLPTQNKYEIFLVTMVENFVGLMITVTFGDNRVLKITYDTNERTCEVTGDKFNDRKKARAFLQELFTNEEFNEGLSYHDMIDAKNIISVNDFYNES